MDDPQQLVQCPYCVSQVKSNRLSLHISRVHNSITGKQQCLLHTDHKVDDMNYHLQEECGAMTELRKNAYDGGGISTVPPPAPCYIDYGPDAENWDDSNHPSYLPLEVTKDKDIMRGHYASGLKPAERKNVILEERARRAGVNEKENADRLNRISYGQQNSFNNFPQRSGLNNRPIVGNLRQPHTNNFSTIDSDSNISSISAQPLRSVTEGSNIDPTTDSDGFMSVNYKRRNNPTIGVTRGRGRGRYNQK